MKVFFDTNVYIAEALLGAGAERMIEATLSARWRTFTSSYVLDEVSHVLADDLAFSPRLIKSLQARILRRSRLTTAESTAQVPQDPKDSPILQAALSCGADYLVTNDRHMLVLNPFEGLQIISMDAYFDLLSAEGLLP